MSRKLVIVESPAKARTIAGYLGDGFEVEASVGHIRDLPKPKELPDDMKKGRFGKFAVDVDGGFEPYYVVDASRKPTVTKLKKALKDADELYLATDEDREGEAIAWHLLEVLKPKVPVKRMVFHEITKPAIERALANPRKLDTNLVDAQETRRILDRLYGWEMSPVLWRKIGQHLSAGRVQSVAVRLVVDRERERIAFVPATYWDISATFEADGVPSSRFGARLTQLDGQRVATGKDFDDAGQLKTSGVVALDEAAAEALVGALSQADFQVADLATKPYRRRPAAPFTTATYQQEASRKLRLGAQAAMRVAQRLYENGYITYMRTDSVNLSEQAISAARRQAAEMFGPDYVPDKPRHYTTKAKGAQEAHEAIRPAGDTFRTPDQLRGVLASEELKVYELIWKRTLASQMTDAAGHTATVRVDGEATDGRVAAFTASGTVITHRGFLAAYEEGRDQSRYAEEAEERRLPDLAVGQPLSGHDLVPETHTTTPPPRYTEASLVAALEGRGIGRPSTYASIMNVIENRGYVDRRGQALVPTWLAFAVTGLMEDHFGDLVDYDFTAEMEAGLDRIADGDEPRERWLHDFYFGTGKDGSSAVAAAAKDPGHHLGILGLKRMVADQGEIDARAVNTIPLAGGVDVRVGRYGPYLEVPPATPGAEPRRASIPEDLPPDELTPAKAQELLEAAAKGPDVRELGHDPATGHLIVARDGRFGPYVSEVLPEGDEAAAETPAAEAGQTATGKTTGKAAKSKTTGKTTKSKAAKAPKPRSASLFKSMTLDSVTLEQALQLLSLPRVIGTKPDGGEEITAQNGRYGPYIKCGTDSRSLASEDELFTLTLEQALEILAQPKTRRGQARAAAAPLAQLGADPATGKPMVIKDGRFGPYITDGETNVTVPRGEEPAAITAERAAQLLADKRAKGPVKRRTGARKAPAKKAAPRKAAAKK